jgi:UTP--glucose-1-phosphate uridylyltransferase
MAVMSSRSDVAATDDERHGVRSTEVALMAHRIRKAIFPVGGLGTRFLPATKAMPKEMLPLVDKPLIQYAVEEAQEAGIEEFIFVTGRGKAAIEDHFDHCYELEDLLSTRGKAKDLANIRRSLPSPGKISFTRQQRPLGLGHAVWCARHLVGDEPFAVLLADDVILADRPCLRQMLEAYDDVRGNLVSVMHVAASDVVRYGIIDPAGIRGRLVAARGIVEKPAVIEAPSRLAVIGRYVLDPRVFEHLGRVKPGAGGEIQLTDALAGMLGGCALHGFRFSGRRFDCGDKLGFFDATIAHTLARADLADSARRMLEQYVAAPVRPERRTLPAASRGGWHDSDIGLNA